jgi:hypothetical protein
MALGQGNSGARVVTVCKFRGLRGADRVGSEFGQKDAGGPHTMLACR